MPVLSESNHHAPCSKMTMNIGILAAFMLVSCVVLIFIHRRRSIQKNKLNNNTSSPLPFNEKIAFKEYEYKRSPTPTLAQTNLTNIANLESVPPSPVSLSSSSPSTSSIESFEPNLQIEIPRRRSYTKTIEGEVEVTGEIVVSPDGWRRHTRVFGGGVCKACEESERRMNA